MYNFQAQKKMLKTAINILKSCGVISPYAFGGGTALSAFYWNHRFSTDIDIFIYTDGNEKALHKMRPANWSNALLSDLKTIGYGDDYKESVASFTGYYIEIAINNSEKIQFFESSTYTKTPYITNNVLAIKNINIESVEEIIAKKLYYRAEKGNARDIFDIAVAIHKNPKTLLNIINHKKVKNEHINQFENSLNEIMSDMGLYEQYIIDIKAMAPHSEFMILAKNAPQYLLEFIATLKYFPDICAMDELIIAEKECYKSAVTTSGRAGGLPWIKLEEAKALHISKYLLHVKLYLFNVFRKETHYKH